MQMREGVEGSGLRGASDATVIIKIIIFYVGSLEKCASRRITNVVPVLAKYYETITD